MKDVDKILVKENNTIEETVAAIQRGGEGIALVVDDKKKLLGTITDGDVRRAIINKVPLNSSITELLKRRSPNHPQPTVMPVGTPHEELLRTMEQKVVRQIPLLDEKGRVVELAVLYELMEEEHELPMVAVIMAGGRGQRLHPLTEDVPKPMLPLDRRPVLERIIHQLKKSGISDIYISTNYKSEVITKHFGNGEAHGVNINYINESQPLGTVGALSLIPQPDKPILVVNGDVLTRLDYRAIYDFHRSHKALMTVGVRLYEFDIPYGVIETEDINIKMIKEKPMQTCMVNAGIYILEPDVYQYIPQNEYLDMTDLVKHLINDKKQVISFPIQEYWLDIGRPADYERAKLDADNGRI